MTRISTVAAFCAVLACDVGVVSAQSSTVLTIARQSLISNIPVGIQSRIAVDQLGHLYFVDRRINALRVLDMITNQVATVFTAPGTLSDFALDSSGHIWVAVLSNGPGEIFKLNQVLGNSLLLNPPPPVPIVLERPIIPMTLVVDSAGELYVADAKQHSILRVHSDGSITTIIPDLPDPGQMAVDGAGNIYAEDIHLGVIFRYGQGQVRTFIRLNEMRDLALDSSNNLYLAGDSGVVQIGSDGKVRARFPLCPSGAYRVAVSPDGRLFASGSSGVYELPTSNSTEYDFGGTILAASSAGQLAVCNAGPEGPGSRVSVSFSISGINSSEFSESSHFLGLNNETNCSIKGLSGGGICILDLRFRPTSTGIRSGVLSIRSTSAEWTVPLSGTGIL